MGKMADAENHGKPPFHEGCGVIRRSVAYIERRPMESCSDAIDVSDLFGGKIPYCEHPGSRTLREKKISAKPNFVLVHLGVAGRSARNSVSHIGNGVASRHTSVTGRVAETSCPGAGSLLYGYHRDGTYPR